MAPTLHTVGVVVRDMPAALRFYRLLGLEIASHEDASPHVEYVAPSGYAIGFVSEAMVRQTDPQWIDRVGSRVNLQFAFSHPREVDAAHRRLVAAGYRTYQEPWDAFWGQRFARIVDPDENVVNLFAELAA